MTSENILLIEEDLDDQLIARMAVNQLKRDINLYIAADTLEAVHYLRQQAENATLPTMILMDSGVPGENRNIFFKDLANLELENSTSIPVYLLGSESAILPAKSGKKTAIRGHLQKPLVHQNLEHLFAP